MVSVHAALEIAPQILDGVEIRTPCRPADEADAMVVKPGLPRASSVNGPVVLLEPPLTFRSELMSRGHEVERQDRLVVPRIQ